MKPELQLTTPDASAWMPLHGTRQRVTVTTAEGCTVVVTGVITVYPFAGQPGGAVWVTPHA